MPMPCPPPARPKFCRARPIALLVAGALLVIALGCAGLVIGSRALPLTDIWVGLWHHDASREADVILWTLRLPRGLLATGAGAALGIAGVLMQAITRNPLAEPGLFGINAGAAVAVVLGATALGLTQVTQYVWLGFIGAGLAGAAVLALGRGGQGGRDPLKLVLAGAAISILLGALSALVVLNSDLQVLDLFRNWGAGNLQNKGWQAVGVIWTVVALGGALSMLIAPALNAMALGDDMGRSLGADPRLTTALAALAVLLLAGAATATAGPIGFIGLVAAQATRAICGADHRYAIPLAALMAAGLLSLADIAGRVVAFPDEVAAGIISVLIGGPVFLLALHRLRIGQ